jgi:predicted RNA-binding Zn-ribbon protein involved in translation (DUF1610 family)
MPACECFYISHEDLDTPSIYREKTPVARKEHICTECGRIILPGERYRYVFGIWEKPEVYKRCMDCQSICDVYFCDTVPFMGLEEELYNTFVSCGPVDDLISSKVRELTLAARDRIFNLVEKEWERDSERGNRKRSP